MSLEDIHMNTQDLLQKEELDAGGFGMVSLCYHKKYGLVVLKTVYTGPQRMEYNASLLEEGRIMRKLSHDRVVKLLGIILEDGNYSLVMEYVHKGNLMKVLKTSTIPLSVKGRFILEIIEGMLYLNEQELVHKDLKPENILVDDDFHIKMSARSERRKAMTQTFTDVFCGPDPKSIEVNWSFSTDFRCFESNPLCAVPAAEKI